MRNILTFVVAVICAVYDCCAAPTSNPSPIATPLEIAATVDGQAITVVQLDQEIRRKPVLGIQLNNAKNDPNQLNKVRLAALDGLIERLLLVKAAKTSKAIDEQSVQKGVADVVGRYGSEKELADLLKQIGSNLSQFKEDVANDFRISAYIDAELKKLGEVTETEMKKVFDQNPAGYAQKEAVHARHILIMAKEDAPKEDVAKAEQKINELYRKVTAPKADFAAIAKASSECPSKERGGDLGFFSKGMMVSEFENAAFALKPGAIGKPIRSKFGFHIIKLEERKEASPPDFEKSKEPLKRDVLLKRRVDLIKQRVADLRKASKIEIKIVTPS